MDDLILFNDSFDSHLENLNEVLGRLTKAGLKLKPSKCNLLQKEVVFLGHVVSTSGIKPDPSKIESVANWPVPRNVHDICVFVGFCSYYRCFVRGFSTIVSPLTHLLKADVVFEWTDECMGAFQELKDALTSDIVMAYAKDYGVLVLVVFFIYLIYLGFYIAFNTVQVISQRVVGRAEETSTYSSLGFCTVNCRPTASNYQLSHLRP